ncbi:hypothetical protein A8C56_20225 [Niabella ginsenosidivorans]|uniref:Uncharacterized protein n=1 Tax=Niabella ginsenosidivorans TaxID=1176587 RepID=A0A1A9IAL1_9BACT|nr:hypothetical protein A8C56_20225 [Niabella ginsenosidivorans]
MIRTIVRAQERQIRLEISKEYVGKEIEITYIPLEEVNQEVQYVSGKKMKDFRSILSDETAAKFHTHIEKSRNEWERNI